MLGFHRTASIFPLVLGAASAFASASLAEEVILTVGREPGGETQSYDLEALKAMPSVTFSTSTIWTEGVHEFQGVPLKSLLAGAGITEGDVKAIALNDYAVTFNVADLGDEAPIVAYHLDGETFPVREKGPLWIVYPYDASADFRTEKAYGLSVWQLSRLSATE